MDEGITLPQSVGLLMGLVAACYFATALLGLRPLWRVTLPTVLAPALFQGIGYLHLGYLDPFFVIAFVISVPVCLVAALFVHGLCIFFRGRV